MKVQAKTALKAINFYDIKNALKKYTGFAWNRGGVDTHYTLLVV